MKIHAYPLSGNTAEINQWKTYRVIDFLLVQRISSLTQLAAVIGSTPSHQTRFFKSLLVSKVLQRFESQFFAKNDLVCLGAGAKYFLAEQGRLDEFTREITRVDKMDKRGIKHDYLVGEALIRIMPNLSEIVVQGHRRGKTDEMPDATVIDKNGKKVAIEMETSTKELKRWQNILRRYYSLLESNEIIEIHYVFSKKSTLRAFQRLYDETSWPRWKKVFSKGGKSTWLKGASSLIEPDPEIKARFYFHLLASHR